MKHTIRSLFACLLCLALLAGMLLPAVAGEEKITNTVEMAGTLIDNAADNTYVRWSAPVKSYLGETDGKLVRVQYTGSELLYERYEKNGALLGAGTIPMELELFGGFFFGETFNFAVFGQSNTEESETVEVLRVVKYNKEMEKLGAVSYYGENTVYPFSSGSLRMAETGGKLYIHTCHKMFKSDDGNNHQANMYFCVDENTMTTLDSFTRIMNISYYGYVSHSFNQFIVTDGTYVFRADHGDASPRGISITAFPVSAECARYVSYTVPLVFAGAQGINSTGAMLGGMALTSERVVLAGAIDDQTGEYTHFSDRIDRQRNVFVLSAAKSLDSSKNSTVYVTDYETGDNVIVGTPQLTLWKNDMLLLMWEETREGSTKVRAALIDAYGMRLSDIFTLDARLSDCAPLLSSDGTVFWYTGDGKTEVLYRLDPSDIGSFKNTIHTWDAGVITTPAGCETEGERTYTCTDCGLTRTETIPPAGHSWNGGAVTVTPDCVTEGERTFTCTVCGATQKEMLEKDPENHAGGTELRDASPATCIRDGYTGDTYCLGCGEKLSAGTVIDGTDLHAWDDGEIVTAPTCSATGEKSLTCTLCGATTTQTLEKDPENHVGGTELRNASSATCGTDGCTGDTCCLGCGATLTLGETIPKTGLHSFGAWIVTKAATTAAPGEQMRVCTVCGQKETQTIPQLTPTVLPGDVNQDGRVTAADARLALRRAVGLETYEEGSEKFLACDANGDGRITASDARLILRAAVGLGRLG